NKRHRPGAPRQGAGNHAGVGCPSLTELVEDMAAVPPDASHLPRHVAIIMDVKGRWARKRHLPRQAGHVAGVGAVREVVRAASDSGLQNLTLYAFSSENWKRPPTEVGALMALFRLYFRNDLEEMVARGVRVRIIGNRSR